jgi:protocatechuate 3,4-dioxygenase beta subunit
MANRGVDHAPFETIEPARRPWPLRRGGRGRHRRLRCVVPHQTVSSSWALTGASIEIWQCDASGYYSEYAQPGYDGTGETYLRGCTTDANGQVTFVTVYPDWYAGRATHIHR